MEVSRRCGFSCTTSMELHTLWSILTTFAAIYLSVIGEGPLLLLLWFLWVLSMALTLFILMLSASHLSRENSLLSQACILGQDDIVRLLLQHGATFRDVFPSPIFLAYAHGNWNCVRALESIHLQDEGHYEHDALPAYHFTENDWLTTERNFAGFTKICFFCGAPRGEQREGGNFNCCKKLFTCVCTSTWAGYLFCHCRPPPASEQERLNRARIVALMKNMTPQEQRQATWVKKMCCAKILVVFVALILSFVLSSAQLGYTWRYKIQGYDAAAPGEYSCEASNDTVTQQWNKASNDTVTQWTTIQYTRLGRDGFFASFSDPIIPVANVQVCFAEMFCY